MKLSRNSVTGNQIVTGWQPDDFALPQAAELTISPEEILALFKGNLPMRPSGGIKNQSNLQPRSLAPCPSWVPTDLPPFEMLSGDTQPDEIKLPGTLAGATPHPHAAAASNQDRVNQVFEEALHTRKEAQQLIDDAQAQAQEIIRAAQEEAELRLQQAYEQGKAQAEAELASAIQASQAVIQELETWRDSMLSQSEPVVVAMVQDIAQSLFGNGFVIESKVLQDFLSKSLVRARNMGNVRIFINPADAAHIEPDWREYQTAISGQRMQIIPTDNIKPGGCYIEADQGSVDARMDTRMEAVMSVFNQNVV